MSAFESADAFVTTGEDTYASTTATFEATVAVGANRIELVCALPTLDAVVTGETVPDVIQAGWYETLERRLDDIYGAVGREAVESISVTRSAETVLVEVTLRRADPVEATRAAITYVEGTWFQGVIPGYEYDEPVRSKREEAMARGGSSP